MARFSVGKAWKGVRIDAKRGYIPGFVVCIEGQDFSLSEIIDGRRALWSTRCRDSGLWFQFLTKAWFNPRKDLWPMRSAVRAQRRDGSQGRVIINDDLDDMVRELTVLEGLRVRDICKRTGLHKPFVERVAAKWRAKVESNNAERHANQARQKGGNGARGATNDRTTSP